MINTEIVLWAPPCQNLRAPPLRFWHGATRGLNPALSTFQQFCLRVDILVFSNHAVETGHWSALLRLTDTHVCVCVAENYYRYYVWTVKYQDYRYVFLQTTMFQNASCHMNYSFIRQQLVAFNCAKAILLIVVQPCFWLTLELRIKVELCEPFARQYDRLL